MKIVKDYKITDSDDNTPCKKRAMWFYAIFDAYDNYIKNKNSKIKHYLFSIDVQCNKDIN